jgi:hypothetical protein
MRLRATLLDPPSSTRRRPRALGACAAALALALAAVLCPSAAFGSAHGPRYNLKVVSGETTLPEWDQVASTTGSVEPSAQLAVSIVRGGITVFRDVGHGWAGFSQVPQVGDVVTLESPVGTTIGSFVYDGMPTIDPTVCAGSTNFSGSNTPGFVVEGFFNRKTLDYNKYGEVTGWKQTGYGEPQVKSLTGTTYGGSFLAPLAEGETVGASESLKTPLPGEATYTYTSETQRPVGACPPPPPPPPYSPPPPPALQGTIVKLARATIHGLLRFGWHNRVGINQPGTVVEDLFLKGGSLPAFASAVHHRRHHVHRALLLARGSTTAKTAGTVTVVLHPTRRGRARLRKAHTLHVVLLTTLRSASGAKLSLGRRTLLIRR